MKQNILSKIILALILFVIFFVIYLKSHNDERKNLNSNTEIYKTVCGEYEKGEVKIGEVSLSVDIADNECKVSLGLSGKASLMDEGMLFIFENVGNYAFWMKDMNFPIDIIWINETFNVVGIEKDVSPNTFPKSFGENYLAKYVLEVPAQYSDKNNIKIGDRIIFEQK